MALNAFFGLYENPIQIPSWLIEQSIEQCKAIKTHNTHESKVI